MPTNPGSDRYVIPGGVIVVDVTAEPADVALVSATPDAGYTVASYTTGGYLSVYFSQNGIAYSMVATWNGYSPQAEWYEISG